MNRTEHAARSSQRERAARSADGAAGDEARQEACPELYRHFTTWRTGVLIGDELGDRHERQDDRRREVPQEGQR